MASNISRPPHYPVTIALIGDSILDNFYWLEDRQNDLHAQLTHLGYTTFNFAVDESRLRDVIFGIRPKQVYSRSRTYPYPVDNTRKVHPLSLLNNIRSDLTVISVGGNDLRHNLYQLLNGIDAFINSVFTPDYTNDYRHLLQTAKFLTTGGRIILTCLYCPYLGEGSRYRQLEPFKDILLLRIRNFYINLAQMYDIPVLDLSRTFNPYNRSHYGSTEIEPSNFSSLTIAQCIHYMYLNYRGYDIYYAPECNILNLTREA
jgi:hypothetical protein